MINFMMIHIVIIYFIKVMFKHTNKNNVVLNISYNIMAVIDCIRLSKSWLYGIDIWIKSVKLEFT
jgi:hypothetical protein